MDSFDVNLYDQCDQYINYWYLETIRPLTWKTMEWVLTLQPEDLDWDNYSEVTRSWCVSYTLKYRRERLSNSRRRIFPFYRRGGEKQQSKRKNLRLRKVSKKY